MQLIGTARFLLSLSYRSNLSIRRLFHCSSLELTLSSVSISFWWVEDVDDDGGNDFDANDDNLGEDEEEASEDDGVFRTSNFSLIFSTFIILLVGLVAGGGGLGFSSSSSSRTVSLDSDPTQSEPFRARNKAKESLSLLCFAALNRTPIFLSSPQHS